MQELLRAMGNRVERAVMERMESDVALKPLLRVCTFEPIRWRNHGLRNGPLHGRRTGRRAGLQRLRVH
jgi:hypothetical protein